MATLRKIKSHYYAYFYDPARKPNRKSVTLRTGLKSAAQQLLKRLEVEYAVGIYDPWNASQSAESQPEQQTVRFSQVSEAFLMDKAELRPKTLQAYRTALTGLERTLPSNLGIEQIATRHIRPYIYADNVSGSTKVHRYTHVRVFFRWAQSSGYIESNPLTALRRPRRESKVPEYLSPADLERLLAAIDADTEMKVAAGQARHGEITWLKTLVILAVNTGLRRGELMNLHWEDVDFDARFLTVRNRGDFRTKSGSERRVPLSPQALECLCQIQRLDGPVFATAKGVAVYPSYVSKRFKYYVRLAKLSERIHFHSLRHTCASWLVQNGVSLPIVQAILGHADIRITQRYAHLAPDILSAAIDSTFG